MVGEILADRQPGPTDFTEHVPAIGDFANTHILAKADFAKLAAGRSFHFPNLKLTAYGCLAQSQGGVDFKIVRKFCHALRKGKPIETVSQ